MGERKYFLPVNLPVVACTSQVHSQRYRADVPDREERGCRPSSYPPNFVKAVNASNAMSRGISLDLAKYFVV